MYKLLFVLSVGALLLLIIYLVNQRDMRNRIVSDYLKKGGHIIEIHIGRDRVVSHVIFDGQRFPDEQVQIKL